MSFYYSIYACTSFYRHTKMLTWCRLVTTSRALRCSARNCSSVTLVKAPTNVTETKSRAKRDDAIIDSDFEEDSASSILAPGLGTKYDFSDYGRQLGRTQTFSAYANKSPTLQKLVDLGVDLSQIEKRKVVPNFILGLDFDRDIAGHIRYSYKHFLCLIKRFKDFFLDF